MGVDHSSLQTVSQLNWLAGKFRLAVVNIFVVPLVALKRRRTGFNFNLELSRLFSVAHIISTELCIYNTTPVSFCSRITTVQFKTSSIVICE